MAFWGVEVKSGKSFTHSRKSAGRLRLSQATLGFGDSAKKSIVQCNVGSKSPVLLCVLLPNQRESCHLDLEFEEADNVVFSVIGPRSVFLAGYYIQQTLHPNLQSDTESHGEDIQNSHSEESNYCSDDDKYEDSFIDDQELRVCSPSPVSSIKGNSKVGKRNSPGKRRMSRYKIFDSDSDSKSSGHQKTAKKQDEDTPTEDVDCLQSKKSKKKRKFSSGDEKTCEVENKKDSNVEDKDNLIDDSNNMKTVVDAENSKRSKRRRKELMLEEIKENGSTKKDFSGTTEKNDLHSDRVPSNLHTNAVQPETKPKRSKKKKAQQDASLSTRILQNSSLKSNDQISETDLTQRRTLSKGLTIEDISFGPPDGKLAATGKTVKMYYTVTSKENGRVLYSNVGETACKFHLDIDDSNNGWKCGIIGMHVGDKRRIIVPPSIGCVENAAWEENLPPNSWLVYEVELVSVRKHK